MYSLNEQPANVPLNPEWKSKSLRRSATFAERLEINTCTVHMAQKVIMEVLLYGIL